MKLYAVCKLKHSLTILGRHIRESILGHIVSLTQYTSYVSCAFFCVPNTTLIIQKQVLKATGMFKKNCCSAWSDLISKEAFPYVSCTRLVLINCHLHF